jgi:predicted DNA-binding transcriptional regulator AlpA
MSKRLLTIPDLALMLGCSVAHARDRVVHKPGFPPPIPGLPRMRRWVEDDVIRFFRAEPRSALAARGSTC